jgi:hypothetical protein
LLTNSEDYTQTNWVKTGTTATANATIAPDGTLTADKLAETAVTSQHAFGQTYTISTAGPHTISFYIKAAERSIAGIGFYLSSGTFDSIGITVDLSNGNYFTGSTGNSVIYTQSVINVGNGWWRVSISGNTTRTGGHIVQVAVSTGTLANPVSTYLGVAGSGVYVWGAQLNTGILQPYIPTTTAAINGANAFVTKWYDQSGIGDNLLLQSQTFENAYWSKNLITLSADTTTAPDGTLTADSILETATSGNHYLGLSSGLTLTNQSYTLSCYLKANQRSWGFVSLYDGTTSLAAWFDLQNGVVGTVQSGATATIQNAGNGWFRCSITRVMSTALTNNFIGIGPSLSDNTPVYLGVSGSGVYIWGAQLSLGSELLRYQPTTTAIAPKRDAVQTTASQQPQIVNSGSVISVNAKPTLQFTNTNSQWLNIGVPIWTYTGDSTLFHVSRNRNSAATQYGSVVSQYSSANDALGIQWQQFPNAGTRASTDVYSPGGMSTTNEQTVDVQYVATFQWRNWSTHKTNGNTIIAINGANQGLTPYGTNPTALSAANVRIGSFDGNPSASAAFLGDIQELVIYQNALSVSGIDGGEGNINSYYNVYWQGNGTALLDSFSGASAAYSLRNLSSAYTGPLIRVRRSNDNVERDIYGTFRGDLDLAALTSFVGANSGFVTTWYDQSGTGRNATQATAGSQPRIVNAGAVDTENGKPAIFFDGTNDQLIHTIPSPIAATPYSVHAVVSSLTQSSYKGIFGLGDSLNTGLVINSRLAFSPNWGTYGSSDQPSTQSLQSAGIRLIEMYGTYSVGTHNFYTNGASSGTYNSTSGQVVGHIGGHAPANQFFNGDISEVIYYNADRTASRIPIESNINNYYKIY